MKRLLFIPVLVVALTACGADQQLPQVPQLPISDAQLDSAEKFRDAACTFASLQYWQEKDSRLKTIHELCLRGENLESIAAVFARCVEQAAKEK